MAVSHAEIRQWAVSRGMKVGSRGRLHPDVIAEYQKVFAGAAVESTQDRLARISKARKYTRVKTELTPVERVDALEFMLRSRGTHLSQNGGGR